MNIHLISVCAVVYHDACLSFLWMDFHVACLSLVWMDFQFASVMNSSYHSSCFGAVCWGCDHEMCFRRTWPKSWPYLAVYIF